MNKDVHIDTIRKQLGITLETISRYNSEHGDEIAHIADIFYLKGSDKEKILVLLFLLSLFEKDDIIQKYCKQTGMNSAEYDPANLLNKYKVPLLTALIYDQAFYAMAVNYRQSINAGLLAGETEEKTDKIIPFPVVRRHFSKTSRMFLAVAAGFVVVSFVAVLIRVLNPGSGHQISNAWVISLREPDNFRNSTDGGRIGLSSPLIGMAMGNKDSPTKQDMRNFTKAIDSDKTNAGLYVNRGIAYTLGGYLDSAVKDFDKAIELDPKNTSAYYNRAIANAGRDAQTAAVIADLETVIALNPGDKDAYYAIGTIYYRQYEKNAVKSTDLLKTTIDVFSNIRGYKDTDLILDYLLNIKL